MIGSTKPCRRRPTGRIVGVVFGGGTESSTVRQISRTRIKESPRGDIENDTDRRDDGIRSSLSCRYHGSQAVKVKVKDAPVAVKVVQYGSDLCRRGGGVAHCLLKADLCCT